MSGDVGALNDPQREYPFVPKVLKFKTVYRGKKSSCLLGNCILLLLPFIRPIHLGTSCDAIVYKTFSCELHMKYIHLIFTHKYVKVSEVSQVFYFCYCCCYCWIPLLQTVKAYICPSSVSKKDRSQALNSGHIKVRINSAELNVVQYTISLIMENFSGRQNCYKMRKLVFFPPTSGKQQSQGPGLKPHTRCALIK